MSRFCQLCGRVLGQLRYEYPHPAWPARPMVVCAHCRRLAPRCRRCQQPMRADLAIAGLCARCASDAPRCLACGMFIAREYYEINRRGPFCPTCYATRQRCEVCASPLDNRARYLPDGRAVCSACQQTAIIDTSEATHWFDDNVRLVYHVLGLSLRIGARFVLTDRPGLQAQIQQYQPGMIHSADRVLGVYVRDGRLRTIYIENGLPRILFIQVAAHEWAHAWQAENCPLVRDVLVVEGFAEWVAYKVLQAKQAVKKMQLMIDRVDWYGEWLRMMLACEARGGVDEVLASCRARSAG